MWAFGLRWCHLRVPATLQQPSRAHPHPHHCCAWKAIGCGTATARGYRRRRA